MATNFPLSASVGQYFDGYMYNGTSWEIVGEKWKPITYSPVAPEYHEPGFIWVNSNEVVEEISYVSASGYQILTNKVMSGNENTFSDIPESATLPSQTGNNGKFLTTDGSSSSWATVDLTSAINTASAAAVTYLVDSAPSTLDTLNELAAALGDDPNYATTITNALASKLNISTASSTYLTQLSASTTYALKNSPSITGSISLGNNSIIGPNNGGLYISSSGEINLTLSSIVNLPSNTRIGSLSVPAIIEQNTLNPLLFVGT